MGGLSCELCGAGVWTAVRPRAIADDVVVPLCDGCSDAVGASDDQEKELHRLANMEFGSWTSMGVNTLGALVAGATGHPVLLLGTAVTAVASMVTAGVVSFRQQDALRRQRLLQEPETSKLPEPKRPDQMTIKELCEEVKNEMTQLTYLTKPDVHPDPSCEHCERFKKQGAAGCLNHFIDGIPFWWKLDPGLWKIVDEAGSAGVVANLIQKLKEHGGYDGWGCSMAWSIVDESVRAKAVYDHSSTGAEINRLARGLAVIMAERHLTVDDIERMVVERGMANGLTKSRPLPPPNPDLVETVYK